MTRRDDCRLYLLCALVITAVVLALCGRGCVEPDREDITVKSATVRLTDNAIGVRVNGRAFDRWMLVDLVWLFGHESAQVCIESQYGRWCDPVHVEVQR